VFSGRVDGGDVTAVLLTRNRPGALVRALKSLDRAGVPLTIVVIDNDSEPDAAKRIAAACTAHQNVRLRRMDRNLGCAGGRLLGGALAQTERVLFLDDDAELMPGALKLLATELDAHPEAGAVTATVVWPDNTVFHSGGSLEVEGGVATFGLIGSGVTLGPDGVPPSGPADWVPGGAVLIRRELLEAFPIDERMAAYYEDNEWCYRVALTHPAIFRRSREAIACHYMEGAEQRSSRPKRVRRLAACARFYACHGVLLAPAVFDDIPELTAPDGTRDLAGSRILMELVEAKGVEWTEAAWSNGELTGLINAHRWRSELRSVQATLREHEATLAWLSDRHETLCRIEQGGWWRLRGRILPAIRLAQWLRGWWKRVRGDALFNRREWPSLDRP